MVTQGHIYIQNPIIFLRYNFCLKYNLYRNNNIKNQHLKKKINTTSNKSQEATFMLFIFIYLSLYIR